MPAGYSKLGPSAFPENAWPSGWPAPPRSRFCFPSPFPRSCWRWRWPSLLLSGLPLRWPRIAIPLGLFLGWTLVALAFSPDPRFGLPTVRKMVVVYWMLLIVYSSVRTIAEAKWLVLAWIGVGTIHRRARTVPVRRRCRRRTRRTSRISTTSTSPTAFAAS